MPCRGSCLLAFITIWLLADINGCLAIMTNEPTSQMPASLLFPPTMHGPETSCYFRYTQDCRGWQLWLARKERDLSRTSFPLSNHRPEPWPSSFRTGMGYRLRAEAKRKPNDYSFHLSTERSSKIYVLSPDILVCATAKRRIRKGLCATFYYRLMSATPSAAIKVYALTRRATDFTFSFPPNNTRLVWNETSSWPSTWDWLVTTVQVMLPVADCTKAALLFYVDAGDGVVSIDNIEIYNTSCNLRPSVRSSLTGKARENNTAKMWPNAVIPYVISKGFSSMQHIFLEKLLEHLVRRTCVAFSQRTDQTDYVEFVHTSEGCTSQRIGYYGGRQIVHLSDSCFDKSTISHELLHIVGLYHEHQRPDRDEYINIFLGNVAPSYKEQFSKQDMDTRLISVPYDYASVMHYREDAFAAERGLKTMQAKDRNVTFLGNLEGPIRSDYQKIANVYCGGSEKLLIESILPKSPAFRPRMWENGIIPVEFDIRLSNKQREALITAFREMNANTCLRFRPRRNETNYVYFALTRNKCFSRSGQVGGRQTVSLYDGTCFDKSIIFWHLFHVVGLDAEHRRPDRDEFVTVHSSNIRENHVESFQKFESMDWRVLSVPYDVESVLHYSNKAFTKSRFLRTITAKDDASSRLGNRKGPTRLDYAKVIRLYNCSRRYWKDRPVFAEAFENVPSKIGAESYDISSRLSLAPDLWHYQRVPFVINELQFSIFEGKRLMETIFEFNSKTCLKFVPRTNEADYVEFVRVQVPSPDSSETRIFSHSCRAIHFGRIGGRQYIVLPNTACFTTNYYIYLALLVTAGLPEEHRRPDRNYHVNILWQNIADNAKDYFTTFLAIDPRILSVSYDIHSILHYSSDAFPKREGLKTIVAKHDQNAILGNTDRPTPLDYQKVSQLYC